MNETPARKQIGYWVLEQGRCGGKRVSWFLPVNDVATEPSPLTKHPFSDGTGTPRREDHW